MLLSYTYTQNTSVAELSLYLGGGGPKWGARHSLGRGGGVQVDAIEMIFFTITFIVHKQKYHGVNGGPCPAPPPPHPHPHSYTTGTHLSGIAIKPFVSSVFVLLLYKIMVCYPHIELTSLCTSIIVLHIIRDDTTRY